MNKGGRPRHHAGQVKKAAIVVRTTPSIHDALRHAAERNGRSITQEVEARLLVSFEHESGARSTETGQLINAIAAEIAKVEELTGRRWHNNKRTAGAVLEMFATFPAQLIRVDEAMADEAVSKAFDAWFDLCGKRKDMLANLAGLGVQIDSSTATWMGDYVDGGGAGRWRERRSLALLDLPDKINSAAIRLISDIEELDGQIKNAKRALDDAEAPFSEAEQLGRQLYQKELKRRSMLALARMQQIVRSFDIDDFPKER